MKGFVIDASVVLTYLLKGDKEFVSLLKKIKKDRFELVSLELLDWEVRNGLRFSLENKDLAIKLMILYEQLPIRKLSLSSGLWEEVLKLAYQQKVTVYDASYHVLGLSLGWEFLTRDEKYERRVREIGGVRLWG